MSSQCAKLAVMRSKVSAIGGAEVLQRLIGEHDAPAERVVRAVALEDGDRALGTRLLEQQREIQPRRPAADDANSQLRASAKESKDT